MELKLLSLNWDNYTEPKYSQNVSAFLVDRSRDGRVVRAGSRSSRMEAVEAVTEAGKENAVVG